MEVKAKKSVFKEVAKLPVKIQELFREFILDLQSEGLNVKVGNLKKWPEVLTNIGPSLIRTIE